MDYKADYDSVQNVLHLEFSGEINHPDEIHELFDRNLQEFRKIGKRFWLIVNSSNLVMKNSKLVAEFKKLDELEAKKYILGECAYGAKGIQKVMTMLFNTISGKRSPIFATKEQALEWVLKSQKEKGIEAPLE